MSIGGGVRIDHLEQDKDFARRTSLIILVWHGRNLHLQDYLVLPLRSAIFIEFMPSMPSIPRFNYGFYKFLEAMYKLEEGR
jgi:hypothetical protein